VSVQIRASWRDPNRRHARFGKYVQELGREQRIAIVDQIAFPSQQSICRIRQVASDLAHPQSVHLRGDAGNLDFSRRQLDKE
jgi:hypothetical protein